MRNAARIGTVAVSTAGIIGCLGHLALIWSHPRQSAALDFASATSSISAAILMGVALVIAWRGAERPSNLSLALAIAVIFAGMPVEGLRSEGVITEFVSTLLMWPLFLLGAGFFIRAAQVFPVPLSPGQLAASPTAWGRIPLLNRLLTMLLQPRWTWAYAALLTVVALAAPLPALHEAARLGVILSGVVFFYITYRSSDRDSARRVLWFLAAALLVLVIGVVRLAVSATLAPAMTYEGRLFIGIVLFGLENLALLGGIVGAVFYVGAISPGLVIRKTLVYGATAASLLLAFATLQAVIADALVEFFGVTDRIASAFMGTIFGLAFQPLRRHVEDLLKRFEPKGAARAQVAQLNPILVERSVRRVGPA